MDRQNRAGSKPGSGGVISASEANVLRRERLKQLTLEALDISKDPYLMKNHVGSYECKLCLVVLNNEGAYLSHVQGKKHQESLARRAAREAKQRALQQGSDGKPPVVTNAIVPKRNLIKIGRPAYKVTKLRDTDTMQMGLLFQVHYPQMSGEISRPYYRFMSAFEQKIETPDRQYQYILIAAEPYETIAFKMPNYELEKSKELVWSYWDRDTKVYTVQIVFSSTTLPTITT
jgi:splicing factor 3A subunit 2